MKERPAGFGIAVTNDTLGLGAAPTSLYSSIAATHGGRDMTPLEWIMVAIVAAGLFSLALTAWKLTNHE